MKKTQWIVLLSLLIIAFTAAGQTDYREFYSKSITVNNTGMYVLGAWAVLNIATGAAGWATGSGTTKYFHQMNLFWNTVNLSIAGIALISNARIDPLELSPEQMLEKHTQMERLYLINAGLDVLYIGTGFLLKHFSHQSTKRHDLLQGYGNSMILQGGFLLLFDAIMYSIQHAHRMQFLQVSNMSFNIGFNSFRMTLIL
ncbi:MAG TPA: hypothetical protein PK711_04970 [Bacteroidales bacterium]|nr:hypothetical protein [Bacteroidales bacterium]HRZ21105.1 hypothetical protein [Bacteroidales bacterium]